MSCYDKAKKCNVQKKKSNMPRYCFYGDGTQYFKIKYQGSAQNNRPISNLNVI